MPLDPQYKLDQELSQHNVIEIDLEMGANLMFVMWDHITNL